MSSFLSILLPVKNVQRTLVATVHEILELVSECTKDFELLIIDDGSTDATSEVIMEISRSYPQVRAVCKMKSQGCESLMRQALLLSRGELVLLYEEEENGIPLIDLSEEWAAALGETQLSASLGSNGASPVATDSHRSASGPLRFEGVHAFSGKKAPGFSRKRGFRLVDRRLLDVPEGSSRPVQPNFLQHVRHVPVGQ